MSKSIHPYNKYKVTYASAATQLAVLLSLPLAALSGQVFASPSSAPLVSQPAAPLSAHDSDPNRMRWMQGFPPAPELRVKAADGSFFTFPALRYSVSHMRQFMPTVEVSRGIGAPVPLVQQPDAAIDALQFIPWDSSTPMSFADSLDKNYTDGMIILHKGEVVYERYFGALAADKKHAAMSVTKSFTGTLAAVLVAEGTLDPSKK